MRTMKQMIKFGIIICFSLYLSGCMVGPNFHAPAAPLVEKYTIHPLPRQTAATKTLQNSGKAQVFVSTEYVKEQWWQLFRSHAVTELVNLGISHSPTLAAAYATLRQAQEVLNEQIGNSLFPAFNAGFTGTRQRFSSATIGQPGQNAIFNLFNTSVSVGYTLDIFGGQRRQIESLAAQVDYQQFELIGVYLSITSNIVTTSIAIASLHAQIAATNDLIKEEQQLLHIIKQQFQLGAVSNLNVLTQETQVDQIKATLPPLQKSLAQNEHSLDVLVGQYPDTPLPKINLAALTLPRQLPVTLPANLVRQRPDVRAAEALLHAASAQIGVATANLLPQFTISGNNGWQSIVASRLFEPENRVWSLMGGITQPLFHGGALLAARRTSIDAYQQAALQYKQTVLQAFQNVADALRALDTDARTLREQRAAEVAAHQNFLLTKQQYFLGGVDYLNLLTAEQQYQQTKINRIQAQATRFSDTVALFQALGGGWWNKKWCVNQCLFEK